MVFYSLRKEDLGKILFHRIDKKIQKKINPKVYKEQSPVLCNQILKFLILNLTAELELCMYKLYKFRTSF